MDESTVKPPYGRRVMTDIIDNNAKHDPTRPWIFVPRSSSPNGGWKPITFADGANAINRVAHKIVDSLGRPANGSWPTIAYIGPNDVRYIMFMFGAIKAGYKVCSHLFHFALSQEEFGTDIRRKALFISPRNSHEGQMNLFEKTDCKAIWFDAGFRNVVQPWLAERDMGATIATPVDQWFPEEKWPHFPYDKPFDEARWDPMVVLHTSGSTGLPKPIVARQGMISIADAYHNLPEWRGTHSILRAWSDMTSLIFNPSMGSVSICFLTHDGDHAR